MVGGDFNSQFLGFDPGVRVFIRGGLVDLQRRVIPVWKRRTIYDSIFCLDYLLTSSNCMMPILSDMDTFESMSDHMPIFGELN